MVCNLFNKNTNIGYDFKVHIVLLNKMLKISCYHFKHISPYSHMSFM